MSAEQRIAELEAELADAKALIEILELEKTVYALLQQQMKRIKEGAA